MLVSFYLIVAIFYYNKTTTRPCRWVAPARRLLLPTHPTQPLCVFIFSIVIATSYRAGSSSISHSRTSSRLFVCFFCCCCFCFLTSFFTQTGISLNDVPSPTLPPSLLSSGPRAKRNDRFEFLLGHCCWCPWCIKSATGASPAMPQP